MPHNRLLQHTIPYDRRMDISRFPALAELEINRLAHLIGAIQDVISQCQIIEQKIHAVPLRRFLPRADYGALIKSVVQVLQAHQFF